jgi:hypothetical protein
MQPYAVPIGGLGTTRVASCWSRLDMMFEYIHIFSESAMVLIWLQTIHIIIHDTQSEPLL